ncbi:uncharacterized protein LOC124864000 [Girardinichthys multiradiatus]|uniref:uncharacterized protein LOC124862483 n=1 Tax=Girardinichthys multiradiatus TaxID=208333 RepID=UPI001FABE60A|nr:uncharacterized protein LOC124862483 [Girardinichthys multiradiatus]XP_047214557.1 uncharacterized protein LOC124864000 [Girardinichthys multiradiatus]
MLNSMSAVWIKIFTILCLCYTAEMNGVVWKENGQSITIQCRIELKQTYLSLKKGINKDIDIVIIYETTGKISTSEEMSRRVQTHGNFPNIDILIKNLSTSDTGPYWCVYTDVDKFYNQRINDGNGSVLLVVTEKSAPTEQLVTCGQSNINMVGVYVAIAVAALLIIVLGFIVWIMYKVSDSTTKPRRVATNGDVYEDMRGTIRR